MLHNPHRPQSNRRPGCMSAAPERGACPATEMMLEKGPATNAENALPAKFEHMLEVVILPGQTFQEANAQPHNAIYSHGAKGLTRKLSFELMRTTSVGEPTNVGGRSFHGSLRSSKFMFFILKWVSVPREQFASRNCMATP